MFIYLINYFIVLNGESIFKKFFIIELYIYIYCIYLKSKVCILVDVLICDFFFVEKNLSLIFFKLLIKI